MNISEKCMYGAVIVTFTANIFYLFKLFNIFPFQLYLDTSVCDIQVDPLLQLFAS